MKIPRLLSCLIFVYALCGAAEIKSYHVRMDTALDGTGKGLATVQASACAPGQMNLPLGFPGIENLRLEEAPAGVRLELGPLNGQVLLHVFLPEGIPSETTFQFSFTVRRAFLVPEPGLGEKTSLPTGSRLFRHAFVNTQEGMIGRYRFELLFPDGMMAQAIREQLPKPKKNDAGPRVQLSKIGGRQAAILQFTSLKQGDDTSMLVELVSERKSKGWLLAGIVLAGLYLFHFRDLVARKKS